MTRGEVGWEAAEEEMGCVGDAGLVEEVAIVRVARERVEV